MKNERIRKAAYIMLWAFLASFIYAASGAWLGVVPPDVEGSLIAAGLGGLLGAVFEKLMHIGE